MHQAIGIDPASGKDTCIWIESDYEFIKPQHVRGFLEDLLNSGADNFLIAWDAPVSFAEESYSDRKIDKSVRRYIKLIVKNGLIENKSVNTLPFSGLSHWVISCKAIGSPFGKLINRSEITINRRYTESKTHQIVEVHPAVSMALMWNDLKVNRPFPTYKKSKQARKFIVETLEFPSACVESDDILDAYVAYLMARRYIDGSAEYPNDPIHGSYVLPLGLSFNELKSMM